MEKLRQVGHIFDGDVWGGLDELSEVSLYELRCMYEAHTEALCGRLICLQIADHDRLGNVDVVCESGLDEEARLWLATIARDRCGSVRAIHYREFVGSEAEQFACTVEARIRVGLGECSLCNTTLITDANDFVSLASVGIDRRAQNRRRPCQHNFRRFERVFMLEMFRFTECTVNVEEKRRRRECLVLPHFLIDQRLNDFICLAGRRFLVDFACIEERRHGKCVGIAAWRAVGTQIKPTVSRPLTTKRIDLTILYSAFNKNNMDVGVISSRTFNEGSSHFFGEIRIVEDNGFALLQECFEFWDEALNCATGFVTAEDGCIIGVGVGGCMGGFAGGRGSNNQGKGFGVTHFWVGLYINMDAFWGGSIFINFLGGG